MSESIVVALITGVLALIGTIVTASATSDRVDKHNNLVERMAIVEQSTKSAHKRIDGIEKSRSDRPD